MLKLSIIQLIWIIKICNILSEVIVETDTFLLISNEDMDETGSNIKSKPTGEGKEFLKKDQLKRQKILIIILVKNFKFIWKWIYS